MVPPFNTRASTSLPTSTLRSHVNTLFTYHNKTLSWLPTSSSRARPGCVPPSDRCVIGSNACRQVESANAFDRKPSLKLETYKPAISSTWNLSLLSLIGILLNGFDIKWSHLPKIRRHCTCFSLLKNGFQHPFLFFSFRIPPSESSEGGPPPGRPEGGTASCSIPQCSARPPLLGARDGYLLTTGAFVLPAQPDIFIFRRA